MLDIFFGLTANIKNRVRSYNIYFRMEIDKKQHFQIGMGMGVEEWVGACGKGGWE